MVSLSSSSNLFGSVLGVSRQVVEGVVGLSDPTEEHCDHTCDTNAKEFTKQFAHTAHKDIVSLQEAYFVYLHKLPRFFFFRKSGAAQTPVLPVKPQASASRNVLQDMRKKSAVSSSWKSLSLVNLVTYGQLRSLTKQRRCNNFIKRIKNESITHLFKQKAKDAALKFT